MSRVVGMLRRAVRLPSRIARRRGLAPEKRGPIHDGPYVPQRGDVTVTVFNATGGSNRTPWHAFADWFDDLGPGDTTPDAAIVCEADGFHDVLGHLGHVTVGDAPAGLAGHGVREVAVVTKKRPLRARFVQLTRFIHRGGPKPLLWHDRHAVVAVLRLALLRRLLLVSSHAPAVIQGPNGMLLDNEGGREWRDHGAPTMRRILRRAMRWGRAVVHGWDGNQKPSLDPLNPSVMYDELGMEWLADGVMYVAWTPDRLELVWSEITKTPPGSDGHRTLTVTLRPIPLRRRIRKALTAKAGQ